MKYLRVLWALELIVRCRNPGSKQLEWRFPLANVGYELCKINASQARNEPIGCYIFAFEGSMLVAAHWKHLRAKGLPFYEVASDILSIDLSCLYGVTSSSSPLPALIYQRFPCLSQAMATICVSHTALGAGVTRAIPRGKFSIGFAATPGASY